MNNKTKRGLIILGNGSWDAYSLGMLSRMNKKYNIVVSTLTSNLFAPLIALNEWDLIKNRFKYIVDNKMFGGYICNAKLFTKKGKIRKFPIIIAMFLKKKTISSSNIFRKYIDKIFTIDEYKNLQKEGKEILIGVRNLAEIPSKMHFFNSLEEEFEEFKDWMWCGANFPFWSSLIKKSWYDSKGNFHIGKWNGCNIIDSNTIDYLITKELTEIDIFLNKNQTKSKLEGNSINNLIDYTKTIFSGLKYNIEYEFLSSAIKKLNKNGIKVVVYWLPKELNNNNLFFDYISLMKWWEEGYSNEINKKNINVYYPIKKEF